MGKLNKKGAIVTGATSGIGRETAVLLSREGASVVFTGRNKDAAEETSRLILEEGGKSLFITHDVANEDNWVEVVKATKDHFGPIDILVNNVGGSLGSSSLINDTIETYQNVFDVNFWSSLKLMKIYSEKMVKSGWGRIINISSIFGREYGGKSASYMASKASLIAATKHLSIDLADKGVTVNSIAPGSVKHEGGSWEKFVNNSSESELEDFIKNNLPMKDFGTPEPIGDMVSFLSSPRSYLITGACINIDGGQSSNLF